jgi:hypothetical protein
MQESYRMKTQEESSAMQERKLLNIEDGDKPAQDNSSHHQIVG